MNLLHALGRWRGLVLTVLLLAVGLAVLVARLAMTPSHPGTVAASPPSQPAVNTAPSAAPTPGAASARAYAASWGLAYFGRVYGDPPTTSVTASAEGPNDVGELGFVVDAQVTPPQAVEVFLKRTATGWTVAQVNP